MKQLKLVTTLLLGKHPIIQKYIFNAKTGNGQESEVRKSPVISA